MKMFKVFAGVAALLALLVFITGAGGKKYAVEHRAHVVQAEESLFYIAAKYAAEQDKCSDLRELVYDIEQANGLRKYTIYPGQVLIVPLARRVDK